MFDVKDGSWVEIIEAREQWIEKMCVTQIYDLSSQSHLVTATHLSLSDPQFRWGHSVGFLYRIPKYKPDINPRILYEMMPQSSG